MTLAETPIIVAGLCRCGSSLTMQMLAAAGVPVFGNYPDYEPEEVNATNPGRAQVALVAGRAAKILDPHRSKWPAQFEAKIIWLDRDTKQQAKSQVKLLQSIGLTISGQAWRDIRRGLRADRLICSDWWKRSAVAPLFLQFEELVGCPNRSAAKIAEYLGLPEQLAPKMAAQVLPRTSECKPDLWIEMFLIQQAEAKGLLYGR